MMSNYQQQRMSKSAWKKNKDEIIWNLVNSILAGMISLATSFISLGEITQKGLIASGATAALIAVWKFSNYWQKEKKEYSIKMFNFI